MAHLGDPVWEFLIDVSKYFAAASYRTIKAALWRAYFLALVIGR
jgi:hypothetical protein